METIGYVLLQSFLLMIIAPLIPGIIEKIKGLVQKRRAAPIFQMYYDIAKLIRKECVVSTTASWIFLATPYLVFLTSLVAGLLIPISTKFVPTELPGDAFFLVSLLALGRFFMMLSGLDTGSTFGGMGSSREAMIAMLIEPSIFLCLFTAGVGAGSTSLLSLFVFSSEIALPIFSPVYIMLFLSLLVILMAETARIPFDDPATHLELTMVHEAMVLEYAGRQLALMEYGAALKQLLFMTLMVNLIFPHDQWITASGSVGLLLSLGIYGVKIIVAAVVIGLIEVSTVKFRLFSIPNLAALAFILSFLGFFQCYVLGGGNV